MFFNVKIIFLLFLLKFKIFILVNEQKSKITPISVFMNF